MIESDAGAYPEASATVPRDRGDGRVAQSGRTRCNDKRVTLSVVLRQPARTGTDPQATAFIHVQSQNEAVGKSAGGLRVGGVVSEVIPIPPRQPVLGRYPKKIAAVLGNGGTGGDLGVSMMREQEDRRTRSIEWYPCWRRPGPTAEKTQASMSRTRGETLPNMDVLNTCARCRTAGRSWVRRILRTAQTDMNCHLRDLGSTHRRSSRSGSTAGENRYC